MESFVRGIILGITIAAPVGPIGLLCIRRTMAHGWRAGFVSGLGAATADTFYGVLAAFGLTALAQFQRPAAVIGGFLLLFMGWQTMGWQMTWMVPTQTATANQGTVCLSSHARTLTNPATILVSIGLLRGISSPQGVASAISAAVGVGTALWWLTVSQLTTWLSHDIIPQGMV
jgi:threonine/homoserine/homoserine lactone efflux protein